MGMDSKENEMNSCPGRIEVPTPEETVALQSLRSIKERVRQLKSRMRSIGTSKNNRDGEELSTLKKELERLRSDWDQWETKRQKAARERMILLGHEDP